MKIKASYIAISFIILLLLTIITLLNINSFMKSEVKCESGFAVINKCGCSPDDGFDKMFGIKNPLGHIEINITNFENGTN